MVAGKAEIFGSELVKSKKYLFTSSSKVAVYTWHGCTVAISLNIYLFSVPYECILAYCPYECILAYCYTASIS